jgi:predicted DNA-binding transcriptional regulator YafY
VHEALGTAAQDACAHREVIDRASRAIADRRTVQMRYLSASRGKSGRREVDPYHLWYAAGGLYLIGYCRRRRDVRMFAVERICSLTITDHPYQLPLGFVEAYVQAASSSARRWCMSSVSAQA